MVRHLDDRRPQLPVRHETVEVLERFRLVPVPSCRLPQADKRDCLMAEPEVERLERSLLSSHLDVTGEQLP